MLSKEEIFLFLLIGIGIFSLIAYAKYEGNKV